MLKSTVASKYGNLITLRARPSPGQSDVQAGSSSSDFVSSNSKGPTKVVLISLAGLLIGCSSCIAQTVLPPVMNGTEVVTIGDLLKSLLLRSTEHVGSWDRKAHPAIRWELKRYRKVLGPNQEAVYVRDGIVRIINQGHVASVLKPKRAELGWTVRYSTDEDPSKGFKKISLNAGFHGNECFGSRYEGCDMEMPLRSLHRNGVAAKMLCHESDGPDEVQAYVITALGRKPALMAWWTSGGSGGTSSQIDIEVNISADIHYCTDWFK